MTKKVAIAFNKKLDNLFLIKEDIPETEQMGLHQVQQKGKYSLTPNFEKMKRNYKMSSWKFFIRFYSFIQ